MKTVLDPLNSALDALDVEIARITEHRNDLAALIEQIRADAAPVPTRPLPAVATGKGTRVGTEARPRLVPPPAKPPAARRPAVQKACPVPGCGRLCTNGTGLAAHLRSAHPHYTTGTPASPSSPITSSSVADLEQGLAAL